VSAQRPTVAIDDQAFVVLTNGGVARYFVELIRAFGANDFGIDIALPWQFSVNRHASEAGLGHRIHPAIGRRRVLRAANGLFRSRARGASIIHHTFYLPEWFGRLAGKQVVTVFDMIPEIYPQYFPGGNPHESKHDYVMRADAVLCISECTRRDLLRLYPGIRGEVVVTPLGVSPVFRPVKNRLEGLPKRYLLHVGERGAYKDFATLAHALVGLPRDIGLVAIGGGPFTAAESALCRDLGIAHRCQQRSVSDRCLASIYAHALATVIPSHYEGFGLPALEAMATACPPVLADCASLPEVADEAGWYFMPGDASALAATVEQILGDRREVRRRTEIGLKRAATFRWERTAEMTAEVYRRLAE